MVPAALVVPAALAVPAPVHSCSIVGFCCPFFLQVVADAYRGINHLERGTDGRCLGTSHNTDRLLLTSAQKTSMGVRAIPETFL